MICDFLVRKVMYETVNLFILIFSFEYKSLRSFDHSLWYLNFDGLLTRSSHEGFVFYYFLYFQFQMREAQMCQIVCKITLNDKEAKELKEKIEDEYRVNM